MATDSVFKQIPVQTGSGTDAPNWTLGLQASAYVAGSVTGVWWSPPAGATGTVGWRIYNADTTALLNSGNLGAYTAAGGWQLFAVTPTVVTGINFVVCLYTSAHGDYAYNTSPGFPVDDAILRADTSRFISSADSYPTSANAALMYMIDFEFTYSGGSNVDVDAATTATATRTATAALDLPATAAITGTATTAAAAGVDPGVAGALTATATTSAEANLFAGVAAARAALATLTATASVTSPGIDTLLLPAAINLLNCLCEQLNTLPNPPATCCLRPGDSVVQDLAIPGFSNDDCCAGQAYVRIVGFYMTGSASSPFPSPSTDAPVSPCGVPAWGVQLEMGVFRCIRTDRAPDCTEYTEAVIRQMTDAKAMRAAACCFEDLYDAQAVALGNWAPVGPDGGCLGSTWQISVEILNECEDC